MEPRVGLAFGDYLTGYTVFLGQVEHLQLCSSKFNLLTWHAGRRGFLLGLEVYFKVVKMLEYCWCQEYLSILGRKKERWLQRAAVATRMMSNRQERHGSWSDQKSQRV